MWLKWYWQAQSAKPLYSIQQAGGAPSAFPARRQPAYRRTLRETKTDRKPARLKISTLASWVNLPTSISDAQTIMKSDAIPVIAPSA
jgi:hypothetical protein